MSRQSHLQIGIAAIAFSLFLFFVGIPYGVTSPDTIRNIVLSPVFWPNVLAGLLALCGLGMILTSRTLPEIESAGFLDNVSGASLRLGLMAALMVAYIAAIPVLGMVPASMLAFVCVAFLVKTHHPIAAVIAAVLVPLALYAFFAHVAGVAVPQGEFVRLP